MMILVKIVLGLTILGGGFVLIMHALNYEEFEEQFPILSKVISIFWFGLLASFFLLIAFVVGNEVLK